MECSVEYSTEYDEVLIIVCVYVCGYICINSSKPPLNTALPPHPFCKRNTHIYVLYKYII